MNIRKKIIFSFLTVSIFMMASALYSKTIIDENDTQKQIIHEIKSSISQQEVLLLSYINSNKGFTENLHELHEHIQEHTTNLIESSNGDDKETFLKILELEKISFEKQYSKTDKNSIFNLITQRDSSLEEFLKKNNAHIIRISEYKKYWGDTTVNELLDDVIINIDLERQFVLDFDPYKDNFNETKEDFRKTNDMVVKDLVFLLVQDFDIYINSVNADNLDMQQIRNSLISQKETASKITATSFPMVDDQQTNLIGLEPSAIVYFSEAVVKTVSFGKSCEKNIKYLEENGLNIGERYDVKRVGENKNSIQVLISVIKCQQGLRVNAEEYMESKIMIKNNLDNFIFSSDQKIVQLIDQMILNEKENFAGATMKAIGSMMGVLIFTVVLGIYVSNSISTPINKLRDSTHAIAKGDFKIKTTINGNDEITYLARDIDDMVQELNNQQEELVKSEKLSAIGNLASRMAHDIRNPLSIIQTSIGNIRMMKDKPEMFEKSALRCERAIERITHQTESVLDFVRERPSKLENYSFITILQSAIRMVNIPDTIKILIPNEDAIINCDEKQCEIVFYNLIQNSIQAIGDKSGEITIRIIKQDKKTIIEFEDSGPGIPENIIKNIFDPLFTTKQTGTGLGLASCKNLVKNFDGEIRVSTNPTIFTITLQNPKKLD